MKKNKNQLQKFDDNRVIEPDSNMAEFERFVVDRMVNDKKYMGSAVTQTRLSRTTRQIIEARYPNRSSPPSKEDILELIDQIDQTFSEIMQGLPNLNLSGVTFPRPNESRGLSIMKAMEQSILRQSLGGERK